MASLSLAVGCEQEGEKWWSYKDAQPTTVQILLNLRDAETKTQQNIRDKKEK